MGIFDRLAQGIEDFIAPDEVRLAVDRGTELLDGGDLDGAVRELSRALARAPDHTRAACLLGVALARKGDLDGAERALGQALAVRPDLPEAQVSLGEVLRRKGRLDEAQERFRRALDLGVSDPELLAEAYRGRGAIHLAEGRADKAVRELRKAAAALPADGEINRLLGGALLAKGDLDGARICLEKAAAAALGGRTEQAEKPKPGGGAPDVGGDAGTVVDAVVETGTAAGRVSAEKRAGNSASRSAGDSVRGGVIDAEIVEDVATQQAATQKEAAPSALATEVLASLGEVYRRLGRRAEAEERLQLALSGDSSSVAARLALARLRLDENDAAGAREQALRAFEGARRAGGEALSEVQRTLGRASAAAGDLDGALLAFDGALSVAPDAARPALLDEAMHLALRHDRDARAAAWAETLLALFSEHGDTTNAAADARTDAFAALALGRLAVGDLDEAERLVDRAGGAGGGGRLEARLAAARLHLARGRTAAAAAALRLAAEEAPADPRPRARLAALYREDKDEAAPDLYALLVAAHRKLQKIPETSDLAPEAARIVEILDRPLLVTVMGEFNAGKSTFVNAFVGEEVAPMGITPTTATINVLKYGAERGGRVVYRDDTVKHVAWSEVGPLLRALDEEEATRIRYVEVLYPLEILQRVNVVDTPGLNSIRPEHESTARAFIAHADAILWLFSCRQPGTASEREALLKVHAEGKKALGVVNQIDLVAGEEERREVLAHLQSGFGDLVEALVPFSARDALAARRTGDPERLARSNRAELDRVLEARFFDRAKAIQREVAARRLGQLLDEAHRRGEALVDGSRRSAITDALDATGAAGKAFARTVLEEEKKRLVERLADAYAQAAREVLEFVKPRRWAFGANEASRADRDFLLALIEQQLSSLTEASRARVVLEAESGATALRKVAAREAEAVVSDELRLLDEQVYGRYRAFARGYLRGGRVDDFFTRVLPKLELGEQAIQRALLRDLPALAVLEDELVAPLSRWGERFFAALSARIHRLGEAEELARFEIEERLLSPLSSLRAMLQRTSETAARAAADAPPDAQADAPPDAQAAPATQAPVDGMKSVESAAVTPTTTSTTTPKTTADANPDDSERGA